MEWKGKGREGKGGPGLLEGGASVIIAVDRFAKYEKEGAVGLVLGSGVEDEAQWLLGMVTHRSILGDYAYIVGVPLCAWFDGCMC